MAVEIVGESKQEDAETAEGTPVEIEVSVRPLPRQSVVHVKLPRRLFDDRVRSAALRGSKNPEAEVAVVEAVEYAQRYCKVPIVEVDGDSVSHDRQHDGVAVVAIVMFMPEIHGGDRTIGDFRNAIDAWCRQAGPVSSTDVAAEIDKMILERRKDDVLADRTVQDGDLVMLDAWNTGLGKDAKARIVMRVGQGNEALSKALVGHAGGHVLIGAYPIETMGRVVKAQKVELVGVVQPGQYGKADLIRDLGLDHPEADGTLLDGIPVSLLERLDAHARDRLEKNLPDKAAAWLVRRSADVDTDPMPIDLVGQIATYAASAEIERDGPATTMRKYGTESMEALVDAIIELRVGTLVRAEIVLYWVARSLWGDVDEAALRAYVALHKIPNRAMAILRYGRERVVAWMVGRVRSAQVSAGADPEGVAARQVDALAQALAVPDELGAPEPAHGFVRDAEPCELGPEERCHSCRTNFAQRLRYYRRTGGFIGPRPLGEWLPVCRPCAVMYLEEKT